MIEQHVRALGMPHGRIVVLDGHQFSVDVIGFSADPALTRPGARRLLTPRSAPKTENCL